MVNRTVIEIEGKFVDGITSQASKAERILAKLDSISVKINIDADSHGFDKKYSDVEAKTKKLSGSKASAVIDAVDSASQKIGKVTAAAERLAGKAFRFAVGVVDGATKVLGTIGSTVKSLAGGAYNLTLGVVDKVTAPVKSIISGLNSVLGLAGISLGAYGLVVNPIQMQVDYENLTTAFEVLLGGADAAEQRIEDLTNFASKTPFTRDELYTSNRILEVYTKGAISSDLEGTGGMKMVGDIAAAVNADYQDVATWIGRLYSSMETGGAVGMMTSELQDMGALGGTERETIEKLSDSVASGSMGIEEAWEGVAEVFSRFDGTMEMQSDKLGNLLLGVKSALTNNVIKRLGAGFSEGLTPFLKDFRTWRSENADLIAGWGDQIQEFARTITTKATTAVRNLASSVSDMFGTDEWKGASLAGKLNIAWNALIYEPFSTWWNGEGKQKIQKAFTGIGEGLGEGASNALLFLLGIDVNGAIDDGASIGSAFIQGFRSKFDMMAVTDAFKDALSGLPDAAANLWDKVKSGFTSLKSTFKELIFDPLSEWWDGGGKEIIVSGAAQLGTWLGEGITKGVEFLSNGILSLLGINENEAFSEATAVGKSFWDAFTSAFDGSRITEAITSAISGVWSALPSGVQMLLGGYGAAKVLSGISPVIKGVQSVLSVVGSASKGTGILGYGANAAINLGAGNLANGASLGAGALSAVGLGATAGGIAAGTTVISGGIDIYNATQTEGVERTYNVAKGVTKIGGVAAGAGLGAAIGSVIPVIGTAAGAFIGAGIGGLAGSAASDPVAKGISGYGTVETVEEYTKRIEGLNAAMEGYSEETKEVMRQTNLTGERFKEIEKTNLDKWYGDVSLSMKEISEIGQETFNKVLGADKVALMSEYEASVEKTNAALKQLKTAQARFSQDRYQLEVGMTLSAADSQSYVNSIEEFMYGVQDYVSGQRYEVSLAAKFILGEGSSFGTEADTYYVGLESQVSEINAKIRKTIQDALDENDNTPFEIDFDEQQLINDYTQQLVSLYEKLDQAEVDAKKTVMESKYGNPYNLDEDSRTSLMEEYDQLEQESIDLARARAQDLFKANNIANEKGSDEHKAREQEIQEGLDNTISEIQQGYAFDKIKYYYKGAEEAAKSIEDSNQMVSDALLEGVDMGALGEHHLASMTQDEMYDALFSSFDTSKILDEMKANATQNKDQLLEIQDLYDTAGVETPEWLKQGLINADEILKMEDLDLSNVDLSGLDMIAFWENIAAKFEEGGNIEFAESIRNKIDNQKLASELQGIWDELDVEPPDFQNIFNPDEFTLDSFMEQIKSGDIDLSTVEVGDVDAGVFWEKVATKLEESDHADFAEIIRGQMEGTEIDIDLTPLGAGVAASAGASLLNMPMGEVEAGAIGAQAGIAGIAQSTIGQEQNVTVPVLVTLAAKVLNQPSINVNGQSTALNVSVSGNATGGFISGKQLSWIGEEGPEAIIPLVTGRRDRAIDLWEQTGQILGVMENANGGIYGDTLGLSSAPLSLPEYAGLGGVPVSEFQVAQLQVPISSGGNEVVIKIEEGAVKVEIKVEDGDAVPESIEQTIKEKAPVLAQLMADELAEIFENTPARAK